MRKPEVLRLSAIAAASIAALASPLAAHAQQASPEAPAQLDRIVITSEKRMTMLDTTPAAITALPGSKLQESGYTGIEDVVNLVPNASLTGGAGAGGNTQIFIRGIGNVFILAGGDPGVALYQDGAYVSDMTSSNLAFFDLQRVEILRGPQGALYGRNATGGAMNLISALPTDAFRASVNAVVGNYGRKESEGFISGPVAGGATSVRLSYQVKKLDGWTVNPLAGAVSGPVVAPGPTSVAPHRLDDLDSHSLRLQTLTDLGTAGKLRLVAENYREDEAGPGMPVLVDPTPMIPGLLFGVTPSTDPRVMKSQAANFKVSVDHLLAHWTRDLGDNSLDVTASYRKSRANRYFDGDATEALVATTGVDTHSTDKSVDIHLNSPDDAKLQWLVGATLLRFDQKQDVNVSAQVPLGFLVPSQPLGIPVPVQFLLGGNIETRSTALYTDLRYQADPKIAILGGLRLSRDHKTSDEYQDIAAFGLAGAGRLDDSWNSVPWNVGAEYKLDANSIAYAKVSHGFKSGAVNLGALQSHMVRPENVIAAELGYKTDFAGRRGLFTAALFTSHYKDMQVSQVGIATVELTNASKAKINGAEFELSYKPVQPLTLSAALGVMDPKYSDFVNVDVRHPGAPVNVRGNQLANVAKTQLFLGAEYALPIAGYKATARIDYAYRSKVFFTEFNSADAMQDAYHTVNLAFSLKPDAGHWKVFGYVKNATNTTAITSMSIASPVLGAARQVAYTPPRLFGVGLQLDF